METPVDDRKNWLIRDPEDKLWWKSDRRGYTNLVSEAGRYTFEEAMDIEEMGRGDKMHFETSSVVWEALFKEKKND